MKNIVICLDGTNNKLRAAENTNGVRMFDMLELGDPSKQVGYYDPGVGTFSSAAAWTPVARTASRYAGLLFGAGLRQNLGEAYTYLMSVHEPDDQIYLFGFSRGAYTARALAGMIEVFGIFRRGAENLVPYAVGEYAKHEKRGRDDWKVLREYARMHGKKLPRRGARDHAPIRFVGAWDTVKAAGHLWRQLRWPYTRELPHARTIRHAVAIDEWRRPYVEYRFYAPDARHLLVAEQDLQEVWFAGVHSDVGGMFKDGPRLSDIPLKWMAEQAVEAGLIVRAKRYAAASVVTDDGATGTPHRMGWYWAGLGTRRRLIPNGAAIHSSVARRIEHAPRYAAKLPSRYEFVDEGWASPRPLPRQATERK